MPISPDEALTYDDVYLEPQYSEVLPHEVEVRSHFSRNISLNIPVVSAAMDTVTESTTAIVMAQVGGIGVIHKNFSPKDQAREVEKVKKYESGMILDPITVGPLDSLKSVLELSKKHAISGLPVVDDKKHLVGIITNRDLRFQTNLSLQVKDVMTKEKLITTHEKIGFEEAKKILYQNRIEKLPVLDQRGALKGLITIKDIEKASAFPLANKDDHGRLRVAAAVGAGQKEFERAITLIEAGVDAIVVDTAHGHSKGVLKMIKDLKVLTEDFDVIAGNIATAQAAKALIDAGADGVKVGIGPGSICTTRVVAGIGVPQLYALWQVAPVCLQHGIPFIADGGVKYSGDIVKALASGASSVMIGSLFAGTDESPGEMVVVQGRAFKLYRGMGSVESMKKGSKDRYGQARVEEQDKLVPEGVEGRVPYRGPLAQNLFQLLGGLRSGMGYVGAENLSALKDRAKFLRVSASAIREGHPHDVQMTKDAPNYHQRQ